MVCIQPTNIEPQLFMSTNRVNSRQNFEEKQDPQALNKSLLALAMIGLSTLNSCYSNSYIGPDPEDIDTEVQHNKTRTETTKGTDENPSEKYTYKRMDNILNALGLLKTDSTSITNLKTLNCRDDEGRRYWMCPTTILDNVVYGRGLTILFNDSEGSNYSFIARNASNGGIDVIKSFTDGSTAVQNYQLLDDGSVAECDVFGKDFMALTSYFRKQADGTILQTFANGDTKLYGNIDNNLPWPTPITFSACVADTQEGN